MNNFFFLFLTLFLSTVHPKRRLRKSVNEKLNKEKYQSECNNIYEISQKYNDAKLNITVPFDKDQIQFLIFLYYDEISIDSESGFTEIKYFTVKEYIEKFKVLGDFMRANGIPYKVNTDQIASCCFLSDDFKGKKIFPDLCLNFIHGINKYRMLLFIQSIQKAYQEAIQNEEYILGEVPLSDEEKKRRAQQRRKIYKPFSVYMNKAKNPVFIYKGGQKHLVDEDNYEFPDGKYLERESSYIKSLNEKLSVGCVISFFIPTPCPESYLFPAPMFFNFAPQIYVKSKKNEFSSFYFICGSKSDLTEEIKKSKSMMKLDEDFINVPERYMANALLLNFNTNIFSPNFKLKFSLFSYHNNVLKNFNFQRMIIDNFNNRFQSENFIDNNADQCLTFNDCFGIFISLSGVLEKNLGENVFTGLNEVDNIFRELKSKYQAEELQNIKFYTNIALGMFPLIEFWENLENQATKEELDIRENINFQEGITKQLLSEYFLQESFYTNLINPVIQNIIDVAKNVLSEEKLKAVHQNLRVPVLIQSNLSKYKLFVQNLKDSILELKKIKNELEKLVNNKIRNSFELSLRKNELYTLATMEAIQDITLIQMDFGVASNQLKKFILKLGIAQSFAFDEMLNEGSKIYTNLFLFDQAADTYFDCDINLESITFSISKSLNRYSTYPNFDARKGPLNANMKDYVDAFYELSDNFLKATYPMEGGCMFSKKLEYHYFMNEEFIKNGLKNREFNKDLKIDQELKEELLKDPIKNELAINIFNLEILSKFSQNVVQFVQNRTCLYTYVCFPHYVSLEKEFLGNAIGYEIGNSQKNLNFFAKLYTYILTTMIINTHFQKSVINDILPEFHFENEVKKSPTKKMKMKNLFSRKRKIR